MITDSGVVIAFEPTDRSINARPATTPQDAEASLRGQLSAQIANAQSDIENQLAALREASNRSGDNSHLTQAQSQLLNLAQLQQRVGIADIVTLAGLRAEVNASVAAAQSVVQQAQAAGGASQIAQAALYEASEKAHRTATDFVRDFYDRHIFDKYLEFADAKDEEDYRKREAERQAAIEKALAEHTPEGNLKAVQLERDQLKDAGAHGADRSPDYQRWNDRLAAANNDLGTALANAPGKSNTVKSTTNDPLDAIKSASPAPPEVLANFRAAGVTLADQTGEGHGVVSGDRKATSRAPR